MSVTGRCLSWQASFAVGQADRYYRMGRFFVSFVRLSALLCLRAWLSPVVVVVVTCGGVEVQ